MAELIPAWLMAVACYAAMLTALIRSRRDRRVDGYVGHALALLWLGTVYLAVALGWWNLDDPHVRADVIRLPILLLVVTVGFVHLWALWHMRRIGGKRG